jgi:hypothetical protein
MQAIRQDGTVEPFTAPTIQGFRSVGGSIPNTTGWAVNDLWLDTSALSTSVAATVRVWNGSAFLPTPSGAPATGNILLSDDFTGTDGAVWNAAKWGMGRDAVQGTGGGATLLSNQGVLAASNYGNYSGDSLVSRRALLTAEDDVHFYFSFRFDATTSFLQANARHTSTTIDRETGYAMSFSKEGSTWSLVKITGYSSTGLGAAQSFTYTADTTYKARFHVVGTAIKGKVWAASASEPGSWGLEVTDSTYTSGHHGFSVAGGATNANARRVFIDDVIIYDS